MRLMSLMAVAGVALSVNAVMAQNTVNFNGSAYTQNFNSLPNSGTANTWVNGSTLEGWHLARTGTAAFVTQVGTGSSATGGIYSFGQAASSNRSLGVLNSGATSTQAFMVALVNTTNTVYTQVTISYDGQQWRTANTIAQSLEPATRTNATFDSALVTTTPTGWNAVPAANFTSLVNNAIAAALDGTAAANSSNGISATSSVVWNPGEVLYVRWLANRVSSGSGHGLAIDNVSITAGGGLTPAAISKAVTPVTTTIQTIPGNITYAISGISNGGSQNAASATISATFPAGVTYNAGATTLPSGVTASFSGQTLTITLGAVAGGGTVPDFNVVMTANAAFAPLNVNWTSFPGTDSDATSVTVFNNTNTIVQNDIAAGMSVGNVENTLQIGRPTTSATTVIPEAYNAAFIQSVEFDNKGGLKSNPLGNLLGVNFGASPTTGGLVYVFPTQTLGVPSGTLIGSWTDAETFTHGTTTSVFPVTSPSARARLSGLSVSFCNDKVALSGYENGALYVFDYVNNGDGQAALSNGRIMNDGINNSGANVTVGTTWIDNTHFVAAQPTASGLQVSVYEATATQVNFISSTVIPGSTGFTFTDAEFHPGAPAPLNDKLIISASKFASTPAPGVTTNNVWIFDVPTSAGGYAISAPILSADYSTSSQTLREIALDSTGNLWLGSFGGSTTVPTNTAIYDKVVFNSDLNVMFASNGSIDGMTFPEGTSSSFNGMDVAARTELPLCEVVAAGCSPADIAYGDGEPLPPIGQPGGFNPEGPDGGDFDCFFNFYFAPAPDNAVCDIAYGDGEPLPPYGQPGGFNPGVDGGDFDCFFNYYFNGCL